MSGRCNGPSRSNVQVEQSSENGGRKHVPSVQSRKRSTLLANPPSPSRFPDTAARALLLGCRCAEESFKIPNAQLGWFGQRTGALHAFSCSCEEERNRMHLHRSQQNRSFTGPSYGWEGQNSRPSNSSMG